MLLINCFKYFVLTAGVLTGVEVSQAPITPLSIEDSAIEVSLCINRAAH